MGAVVFISGGIVSSPVAVEYAPAIMYAFYGGQFGGALPRVTHTESAPAHVRSGDAIIDALVGAVSPAGRLPVTMYMPDIITRDIRDVDLASSGGITHTWFSGPVLFPFGFGLSYAQFSFKMYFHGGVSQRWSVAVDGNGRLAAGSQEERLLHVQVSNSGSSSFRSDYVILVFIEPHFDAYTTSEPKPDYVPPSTLPVPREALVAFRRVRSLAPGGIAELQFKLRFGAVFSAFRDEQGSVRPPRGTYALRIGHSRGECDERLFVTVQ